MRLRRSTKLAALFLGAALVAPLAGVGCVPAPAKAYSPDEIAKLESLPELMRTNAAKADPLWGKRSQASFTDAEFAAMADAGSVIQATGGRIAAQFGGKGKYDAAFTDFANALAKQAGALEAAAKAKDAKAAGAALTEMKATCGNCHGVYK